MSGLGGGLLYGDLRYQRMLVHLDVLLIYGRCAVPACRPRRPHRASTYDSVGLCRRHNVAGEDTYGVLTRADCWMASQVAFVHFSGDDRVPISFASGGVVSSDPGPVMVELTFPVPVENSSPSASLNPCLCFSINTHAVQRPSCTCPGSFCSSHLLSTTPYCTHRVIPQRGLRGGRASCPVHCC